MRHATFIGLIATAVWLVCALCSAVEPDPPAPLQLETVSFVAHTPVSADFRAASETAARTIPDVIWQGIENAGWRVRLAEFVVDAAPALRGVHPRGWPQGATWDNSDALHLPSAKLLVVAEKRRNRAGEVVACHRIGGVLRHELGHAFDMVASGRYRFQSSKPEFIAAYQRDVARLDKQTRQRFGYYLQSSKAGRQEAFAEAFAITLGGGSSDITFEEFNTAFPNVVDQTRLAIDHFEPAPASTTVSRSRSRGFGG